MYHVGIVLPGFGPLITGPADTLEGMFIRAITTMLVHAPQIEGNSEESGSVNHFEYYLSEQPYIPDSWKYVGNSQKEVHQTIVSRNRAKATIAAIDTHLPRRIIHRK